MNLIKNLSFFFFTGFYYWILYLLVDLIDKNLHKDVGTKNQPIFQPNELIFSQLYHPNPIPRLSVVNHSTGIGCNLLTMPRFR